MKRLEQRFMKNGEVLDIAVHIYSENGHFERNGFNEGWHIQIGTGASADDYTEINDSVTHDVHEYLPDIEVEEEEPEPEPSEEDATLDDALSMLRELGVDV